ncbi:HAMP domain-containing histidine kinase [Paenibacillus sp. P96]|uniref:histidine kinase n=1 Tax=Paenibacillus zeirhizosphaerae TaxID=2987519 RepID=A0ABT9FX28_9BACL|nr:HAMP domain-containing sensor histidine kinase [Paenibacillus sp. P96]MDP4099280.1 HAMP domain-containing histidine kinase [Paenibacillus sp. P96]
MIRRKRRWRDVLALRSLRSQLLARTILIVAVLLVFIGFLQYILMKDFLYRSRVETMEAQLRTMPMELFRRFSLFAEGASGAGGGPFPQQERPRLLFMPDTSVAVIGEEGTFTDLSAENGLISPRLSADIYEAARENKSSSRRNGDYLIVKDTQGNEQLVIVRESRRPRGNSGDLVQMGYRIGPLRDLLLRQLLIFISLALLALVGGLALMLPVLRRTLVPLSQMVQAVKLVDAGNLTERFEANQGQYEIDRLAVSFNGMLGRLEAAFAAEREAQMQIRRFIADASHELRTPLTSIHGFLEVLLRGAASNPAQLQAALESMHGESKRINKLVEDLLLLAKLDRRPKLELKDTALDRLLLSMKPQLLMLAGARAVTFDLTGAVQVLADSDAIKQVILNLFHNAVQHTEPEHGVIAVTLAAGPRTVELSVRDNGAGMSEEQLGRIFERFFRGDSSRTRSSGGTGLGLAISQSIVEAHGGVLEADSELGQGSVFRMRLPLLVQSSRL